MQNKLTIIKNVQFCGSWPFRMQNWTSLSYVADVKVERIQMLISVGQPSTTLFHYNQITLLEFLYLYIVVLLKQRINNIHLYTIIQMKQNKSLM